MRVGLLTTWNTRCGIAEYSRALAEALGRLPDVDVTVFGSRNHGDRAVRTYETWAEPVFEVQAWSPRMDYDLDVNAVLAHDLDVLHIQYSNLFFHRASLIRLMRSFPGVVALTFHDKVVSRHTFPAGLADLLYAHREDVGFGRRRLIPQGVDVRPPLIKTFGLGKSRDDLVGAICERHGWRLEASYGERRWLEPDELYRWLRDCDAIVLWYDEDLTSGSSAAAPMALSTRRPVFVNDTEWFRDIPERADSLRKVRDLEELERSLAALFADDYVAGRGWTDVAATLTADYRGALEAGDGAAGPAGTAYALVFFRSPIPSP